MTNEERAIWQAAYAAAFIVDLERMRPHLGFDRAANGCSAEYSIGVADLAVYRLRQWRNTERPEAGLEVNDETMSKYYDPTSE